MHNFHILSRSQFTNLGFSEQDTDRFIAKRDSSSISGLSDAITVGLSDSGLARFAALVDSGELSFRDPAAQGFSFWFDFNPPIEDIALTIGASYMSISGEAQTYEVPAGAGEGSIEQGGVDLSHPVTVWVSDEENRDVFRKTHAPAELSNHLDGETAYGNHSVDLLPFVLPTIRRFRRSGRFMVLSSPKQRFDGYNLAVAPVGSSQVTSLEALLDGEVSETTAKVLDKDEAGVAKHLASLPFRSVDFEFDGSFNVDHPDPNLDEAIGWVWVLAGPAFFLGFQSDPNLLRERHDVIIILPAFEVPQLGGGGVPMDADEQSILKRPDLFADDPGVLCKPFDHPSRIVGERRFATVLRVTDPEVGSEFVERQEIGRESSIPWEDAPTRYQAVSLARGHILDMRVRYRSNGYSLGDVAHSMTLAPRQTRRIVKVEFDRRETVRRAEQQISEDEVSQATLHDRSYTDAVQSSLNEWSKGGSKSSTTAAAGGIGFAAGPVVMGGGVAHSRSQSSSWQRSGRDVAASEEQNLRDSIRQYGDSLRSFEATVVNEVAQNEAVEGVSEIVRNINYCHALSIVYYRILRHLRIDTEIAGVSECVFIPLKIMTFDIDRLKRHREVLYRYVRDRDQRIALRHVEHAPNFNIPEIPDTARKDMPLTTFRGSISLRLGITRPIEGEIAEEIEDGAKREKSESKRFKQLKKIYEHLAPILPMSPTELVHNLLDINEAERDRYFQRRVAPHVARLFVNKMRLGYDENGTTTPIDTVDFTLAGNYTYNRILRVDFQVRSLDSLTRAKIENLVVLAPDASNAALPERSFADVTGGSINFSTELYERRATARGSGRDDLINPATGDPTSDGALLHFPVTSFEDRNERDKVKAAYQALEKMLNRELYRYHKIIWWRMDHDQLYTLLDGFTTKDAHGKSRSLAGIVERRPIGILGNTLVFRVSAGIVLDDNLKTPENMLAFYKDGSHREPLRVSLPTSGLYARAYMDSCNACERHSGTTDWVLDNPEPELADLPASLLQSRRAEPADVTPTQVPGTLINLQNAPNAPDPSGFGDILRTVSSADSFRDMAGLAGTQQNTREGLQSAAKLATGFGNMALQQSLARIASDANAAKEIAAVAAANQEAVDMGASTQEAARESTEAFAKRKAEGLGKEHAKRTADRADEIIRNEGGGTQTIVTEDGIETVSKEPRPKRQKDPVLTYSVVPIPGTHQILFLNFETDKSRLKTDHVRALEILTGEIGLNLENVVTIEGHASPSGTDETNYTLGQERATALFNKLYHLAEAVGTPPNYTPSFLRSKGEEGSYRERFRGVPEIANAPYEGDPNDPVEKAVLFTFKPSVDVRLKPKVVNFFGVQIKISGHFIIIGNTIVTTKGGGDINIVDRSTTKVRRENITSETIKEDNRQYEVNNSPGGCVINLIGDNNNVNGSMTCAVDSDTGKVTGVEVETAAEAKEHTAWRLQFSAPSLSQTSQRSLMDLLREVADAVSNLVEIPTGSPAILVEILEALLGTETPDAIVDLLLDKLGITAAKPLLEMARFGHVELNAEFKAEEDADAKITGKMGGAGLIIGTTKSAPSAVVLQNAPYTTSRAFKVKRWDDHGAFRDFAYVSGNISGGVLAIARAMALIVEMNPFLRGFDLSGISAGMASIQETIDDLGLGSQLIFRAFAEDTPLKAPPPGVHSIGQEVQAIVITPGAITFNDA